ASSPPTIAKFPWLFGHATPISQLFFLLYVRVF
ncbi:unnamed protein product, partial [marine sediment metagenome]